MQLLSSGRANRDSVSVWSRVISFAWLTAIRPSLRRPSTSQASTWNADPVSESHFKTLNINPGFLRIRPDHGAVGLHKRLLRIDNDRPQFFRAGSRHGCYRVGRVGGRAMNA
jgi:hypothetical protein